MYFRRPIFINHLSADTSQSLAQLSGIEALGRSLIVGVLPIIALKAFGNKETISAVYFISTIITLVFTLNIATLEKWLDRRSLMTLSGLMLIGSVALFAVISAPLFTLAVGLRGAGATIFSICLSLYIMDYIGKRDLTRSESRRMVYQGVSWLIGPTLGVWLYDNIHPWALYTLSAAATALMLIYFWRLRLGDDAVIRPANMQARKPWRAVGRFMSQKRLRVSYMVTLSRACYWSALFVYGPIYAIEAGLPIWVSGVLLSGVSGFILLSPLFRQIADRYGVRQLIIACFFLTAVSLIGLGFLGTAKPIGLLFWIVGATGASGIDVVGNIPFMRMVRPRERSEMTMVFTTWREMSSLLTQGMVFLTLLIAPFWVFYFVLAVLQVLAAAYASFLPRRL